MEYINIKVPNRMVAKKPNDLSYLENVAWDYFFHEKGWHILLMDDAEGYLILDETLNLENAFFQCEMDSVKYWLYEKGVELTNSEDAER